MFCKKCGCKVSDNAKFCGVCGAKVDQENESVTCKKCGNEFKKEFGICPVCGTPTENNAAPAPIQKADNVWGHGSSYGNSQAKPLKRTLKWWHILLIAVSFVLVLCIIVISVTTPKSNKNSNSYISSGILNSTVKGSSGMLQPGAASMDELIDTLSKNSLFSDECISMMSNSMLWWMFADEFDHPNAMYGNAAEIRSAIKYEFKERYDDDDDFEDYWYACENFRVHIEQSKKIDFNSADMYEETDGEKYDKALLDEGNVTDAVFVTSGYVELDGEKNEFDFDENSNNIIVIKANDRYYWCAIEMF